MKPQATADVFDEMGAYWAEIADKNQTSRQLQFLMGQLCGVGGAVLDVACGTGRHTGPLAGAGFDIVGLDTSRRLLGLARQRSQGAALVLGDMRALPFRAGAFDLAVSMDTSFGYLPTRDADRQSLTELRRVLQRGGRFVLDVFNREHLIRRYPRRKQLKWLMLPLLLKLNSKRLLFWAYRWLEYPSFLLLQKRTVSEEGGWLCDFWVVYDLASGHLLKFRHRVHLYGLGELEEMLEEAGFAVQKTWGGYGMELWGADSSRLILLSAGK
ncbi:MAG: class I SAM-dependent methyltransferase [Candidatus Bathyarchaeota archaeon]|nr:class I SAM-dependent methyltransferase [Candidatus Bathyarchaeota archaeon]